MKLVTFQSFEALNDLESKGYLECNPKYIDKDKMEFFYNFINLKMNSYIHNKDNVLYPLWCWVKFREDICPPKVKGEKVKGFDVKITFKKDIKDVFITDYRRYSFILNNKYIATSLEDKKGFDNLLNKYKITDEELKAVVRKDKFTSFRTDSNFKEICDKIYKSFDRCITTDSDVLQGCVYRIYKSDIESIEVLEDGYIQGSFNYLRNNGKRFDWIFDYNKNLK